ncbi:hypothetical protein [Flavihumibacter sp. UBA7668]|uniref:hypothetical protein n=1 Tax=Flavihumibacter sp. UBA7668 TaxID=1946542 RepID=UPI0025BC0F5F|nr:hypothetical protein [Flavihumibacter sp. UBA7668]
MNQFKRVLLAGVCLVSFSSGYAFPFFHSGGIMGGLISDEPTEEILAECYTTKGSLTDTVPKSLEDHLRSLDKAEKKLTEELSSKNWLEVEKSMQSALAKINSGEIERELAKAMKSLEESKLELAEQLKENVFSKEEMAVHLKALEKAMQELKIDQQKIKAEMESQRKEIKLEIEKSLPNIEIELKKAKTEIANVRKEFTGYKEMISKMKTEGLIKDASNYKIEYDETSLTIDGVKQPESVYKKYQSYFKKKKMVIENRNNHFEIESDQDKFD